MLYALAHFLRDKCPWIWDFIEQMNSWLFSIRYGSKLNCLHSILEHYQNEYQVDYIKERHLEKLASFFQEQPEEAFKFFKPHGFDEKTLRKLQRNKAFLSFIVQKDDNIVGYFFLRCYFMGKCFRGYMVDYRWRNRGISKMTARVMTDVATLLGIPSYGTIAPENMASMKSQGAVNDVKIIEQLENGDFYVEYCPRA
ncbi:MAG: transcriptional regulator [Prevotella sp.]|nr:transcriptional regulator [Prevotella sp.]